MSIQIKKDLIYIAEKNIIKYVKNKKKNYLKDAIKSTRKRWFFKDRTVLEAAKIVKDSSDYYWFYPNFGWGNINKIKQLKYCCEISCGDTISVSCEDASFIRSWVI